MMEQSGLMLRRGIVAVVVLAVRIGDGPLLGAPVVSVYASLPYSRAAGSQNSCQWSAYH